MNELLEIKWLLYKDSCLPGKLCEKHEQMLKGIFFAGAEAQRLVDCEAKIVKEAAEADCK